MMEAHKFFIDGKWMSPSVSGVTLDVTDPSTGQAYGNIALGCQADVDLAVSAARRSFETFSGSSVESRIALLERILAIYDRRYDELAYVVSQEMGAPMKLSREAQAAVGRAHIAKIIEVLRSFSFEKRNDSFILVKEPIGVVAMITPWNWPLNQITCKVAPALAAGCTMVLKPSEIAPFSGVVFAEIMEEAGVPAGVFNLVQGDGPTVGQALAAHPEVDMVSFTGSTRAGVQVAKVASETVKRVHQELGGKSANIIFRDADLPTSVEKALAGCFLNSGQTCNAPTRLFVPAELHDEVLNIASEVAPSFRVGPANDGETVLGPVVSQAQFDRVQRMIARGIEQGATLVVGGLGNPEGLGGGYFVRPTVFGNVDPSMDIAREEIFGPVLSIIPYDSEEDAIREANNTVYGLAAYIQTSDPKRAQEVARRLRAGSVFINYPQWDPAVPFGGYKQSGNGREYAEFGLDEYLEVKGIAGAI